MLPRWHFLFGAIFTIVIWASIPEISFLYLAAIFFGAFLIDFDHYLVAVFTTKKLKLKDSFKYHEKKAIEEQEDLAKGIRRKSGFHLFHTIEFHVLVGLFSIFWLGFFYIFMGMIFHSLLDVIDLLRRGVFHRREYFFFNWVRKKSKGN